MVANEQKWADQIGKYLSGNATEQEVAELDRWRSMARENQAFYEEMKSVWQITEPSLPQLQPNFESSWSAIERSIVTDLPDTTVGRNGLYRWLAAAAAVILLLILFYPNSRNHRKASAPVIATAEISEQNKELTLPDGSRVWLKGGSSLTYDPDFKERLVELEGEGFFDVDGDPENPFRVVAGNATATVLGTRFNLRATYNAEVELFVEEGKVEFGASNSTATRTVFSADEAAVLRRGSGHIERLTSLSANALSWRSGTLTFDHDKFSTVLEDLNRHYGEELAVENNSLLQCELKAQFNGQSLKEVIETIQFMMNWEVKQDGDNLIFSGPPCMTE